ncbi:Surface lipoprotein [Pacificimonas flava]|uniref:Surface lipoprotein n=2 Tax=Pacificimonas flava TaxID=1234595 RepID=M2SCX4_9SPHN|nr:Surface lipoprotein [Pacificimonas flava]
MSIAPLLGCFALDGNFCCTSMAIMRVPILIAAALTTTACATMPAGYEDAQGESLGGFNRGIYSFNNAVDSAVLKPVATGYRDVAPAPVRTGVTNIFQNFDEPLNFVNALLQGKIKRAFRAVDRFAVNSTYGVLGTTDRAAELGLEAQPEDFGQTLAVWGLGSGPYVMLPLLGPSTVRDAVGTAVDIVTNPWTLFENRELGFGFQENFAEGAVELVNTRANLIDSVDPILENALDPYATMKSAYLQNRLQLINDGNVPMPSSEEGGGAFGDMETFEGFTFEEDGTVEERPDETDRPADDAEPDDSDSPPEDGAFAVPQDATGAADTPPEPPVPDGNSTEPQ